MHEVNYYHNKNGNLVDDNIYIHFCITLQGAIVLFQSRVKSVEELKEIDTEIRQRIGYKVESIESNKTVWTSNKEEENIGAMIDIYRSNGFIVGPEIIDEARRFDPTEELAELKEDKDREVKLKEIKELRRLMQHRNITAVWSYNPCMGQYFYYPGEGFVKVNVEQFPDKHVITYTSLKGKEIYKGEFVGLFRGEKSIGVPYHNSIKEAFLHQLSVRKKIFDLYRVNGMYKKAFQSVRSTPSVVKAFISAQLK